MLLSYRQQEPALYDQIGRQYRTTRAADPRITDRLVDLMSLPAGSVVCDVGAGSGSYTNALAARGYRLLAIEPSEVMREQAFPQDQVAWVEGVAERLPLPDRCADSIVCTLAAHHFGSLRDAACEMQRVCPEGPFVFFTMDPRTGERTWFEEYFPEIRQNDFSLFPALNDFVQTINEATGRIGAIYEFPLPNDLIDHFMYAPWNRPETYLDPIFRQNTSSFASADQNVVNRRLAELRKDVESGAWDARYRGLRARTAFDAGFRFVAFRLF
jgi:ubiquinone/menaquinone biosynthesis C-methylase UbiE